jgi:hypothetical protein
MRTFDLTTLWRSEDAVRSDDQTDRQIDLLARPQILREETCMTNMTKEKGDV